MNAVPEDRPTRPEPVTSVLIVEDEESLAESVRYNLEREGFRYSWLGTAGKPWTGSEKSNRR